MQDDKEETERVLIIREWYVTRTGMAACDRRLSLEEWLNYEPDDNVNSYAFREMDADSVRPYPGAAEHLLDGENVTIGMTFLVGKFMQTSAYLATLSSEKRIDAEERFTGSRRGGVCVHPNGDITEIYGTETLLDPVTGEATRVVDLALSFDS